MKEFLKRWSEHVPAVKFFAAVGIASVVLVTLQLFTYAVSENDSDSAYQDYFNASYKVFDIRVPRNLNFAGEKTPVTDFTVREAVERELIINTYWQSQSLLMHKRAARWFPVIEPILAKHDIPADFKYIALVESQLTNAVSPRGATGFWQLVEPTAVQYGLEVNEHVDERYHVAKATEAACRYFKEAYRMFRNWTMVAASYNLGMGGIQGQLNRQKADNYYELHLPEETARYVYRILAIKEVISRPRVYGYHLRKKDVYPPVAVKKITVDTTITDLASFAAAQGISYKALKVMNPWLRSGSLPNEGGKKYIIDIPRDGMNLYDMEGNYPGSDQLAPSDSIYTSMTSADTAKKSVPAP